MNANSKNTSIANGILIAFILIGPGLFAWYPFAGMVWAIPLFAVLYWRIKVFPRLGPIVLLYVFLYMVVGLLIGGIIGTVLMWFLWKVFGAAMHHGLGVVVGWSALLGCTLGTIFGCQKYHKSGI